MQRRLQQRFHLSATLMKGVPGQPRSYACTNKHGIQAPVDIKPPNQLAGKFCANRIVIMHRGHLNAKQLGDMTQPLCV
jgi:hypothetical protein